MTTHKFTDLEIKIRIVPKHLRWPESHTSPLWAKAHDCVDALQDLIRSVDIECAEAEQNRELSGDAVARRRAELCDLALRRLLNFRPFEIAEKALIENINALERLSARDPQQVQRHRNFTQSLRDLREGIEATRRMVRDRCKIRDVVSVSHWR